MSDPTSTEGASPDDNTILNSQALRAAEELRQLVADDSDKLAGAGLALAIAQTASIALQDAADHMRRVQTLTEASYANALCSPDGAADAQGVIDAAAKASLAASDLLSKTGDAALAMLDKLATATK